MAEYMLIILMIIMPYNYIGEGTGSIVLLLGAALVLLKHRKEIKVDKKLLYLLISLFLAAVISFVFTDNIMDSFEGLTIYMNAILYYIIFSKDKIQSEKIMDILVYSISIVCFISAIYQGIILKQRIDANFGYADSYALILLAGCYFNEIRKNKRYAFLINTVLFLGIIYTSSRNTLFYMIIFIAFKLYTEYRNKNEFLVLPSLFISLIMYTLLQYLGIGILIVMIIILCVASVWVKDISQRTKNIFSALLGIVSVACAFIFKTNFLARIKNISFNNGTLQERFVFFQDAVKHILNNPLGSGINMFRYRQYFDQTAFYDVKYIHNSFLQVAYDIGIFGLAIFILIFMYGTILIYKSNIKGKEYYLLLYVTIFLHSLLDFDFSFAPVFIIAVIIAAFAQDEKSKNMNCIPNLYINGLVSVLSVYLIFCSAIIIIGNSFEKNGSFDTALKVYSMSRNISIRNSDIYLMIAQTYNEKAAGDKNNGLVKLCISDLKEANAINPSDTMAIGNLAFANQKIGNLSEAVKYYDMFISSEKFYYKAYQVYYNFLEDAYDSTKDSSYKKKMEQLKKTYYNNLRLLNPKARYMKDQMPDDFDEMLKIHN